MVKIVDMTGVAGQGPLVEVPAVPGMDEEDDGAAQGVNGPREATRAPPQAGQVMVQGRCRSQRYSVMPHCLSSLTVALALAMILTSPVAARYNRTALHFGSDGPAVATGRIVWWTSNDPAWVAANSAEIASFAKAHPSINGRPP